MTREKRIEVLKIIKQDLRSGFYGIDVEEDEALTATIAELELLEKVEKKGVLDVIKSLKLSQSCWEGDEDIVICNGKPIGMTITKHNREFDRWIEEYQKEVANAINAHLASKLLGIEEFLHKVSDKGAEMLKICEKENFVFNKLNDRWQKLAFTFYSEIVQLSIEAQAITNLFKI